MSVNIISLIVIEKPHKGGLGPLGLSSHKNPLMSSVLCEFLGYGIGTVDVFWYILLSLDVCSPVIGLN
jgi:hypothetical protein